VKGDNYFAIGQPITVTSNYCSCLTI